MTTDTTDISPAFAACEALFTANPHAVTDEGDSGQVMSIITDGGRLAPAGTPLRLVRHDTAKGRFYCAYPAHSDRSIVTIGQFATFVPEEIAQELASASAVSDQENAR